MMADETLMILSPAMEALQLLDDAAQVMADELGHHIAQLNYMVGRGIVPTDKTRLLWASQMASKFGGMIRTAIEGERAKARLVELEAEIAGLRKGQKS